MSLLQDVLRTQTIDQTFSNLSLTERLQTQRADPESDEEIIGVVRALVVYVPSSLIACPIGLRSRHPPCVPGSFPPYFAALITGPPRRCSPAISRSSVACVNAQRPSQGFTDRHIAADLLKALDQGPRTLFAGFEEVEQESDSELR